MISRIVLITSSGVFSFPLPATTKLGASSNKFMNLTLSGQQAMFQVSALQIPGLLFDKDS